MLVVKTGGCGGEATVERGDPLWAAALSLPPEVHGPERVCPEVQPRRRQGPLELTAQAGEGGEFA